MNGGWGAGRDTQRRARFRLDALTAVLAATIVLASACGGSASAGSGSAVMNFQKITTEALAYAKCMRAHGIPNFPDPTVQDSATRKGITFSGEGLEVSSPRFKSADKVCRHQTSFGVVTPAMVQAAMANGLKFAECMRSHGITNYPDPVDHGSYIQLGPGRGGGIDTHSARFQAARKACIPLLPNGGP